MISLIVVCVYRKRKQRSETISPIESTTGQGITEAVHPPVTNRSSVSSIYDEIEMYQSAGTSTGNAPPSAYTVLTRDPYAYDELYGLQRIAILTDPSSNEEDQGTSEEMRQTRAWVSLPINLHQVKDKENVSVDQCEYVDMLPNCLEVNVDTREKHVAKKGISKSMSEVVGLRNAIKDAI